MAHFGGRRIERRIAPGDDDLPRRVDVGNVDRELCCPDLFQNAFHVRLVEALDGCEAVAAREGCLHQFATQADEWNGIGKGQGATGDRGAEGADRHAGDGSGLDVFGHQGPGRGDAGDQQRGLNRGRREQRLRVVEGSDIDAEDVARLLDRPRTLSMLRKMMKQALALGPLSDRKSVV